ncbi:MAG: hypothetical protein ABSF77_18925 [Spirochaetia bacterium]|jgi:hypothetical protein
MMANFGSSTGVPATIVLEESARDASLPLSTRWKKPTARVHVLENGLAELAGMVESSSAARVVLASLSCVCVVDSGALFALVAGCGDQVVKVSLARTPIEMYCGPRDRLARLIASAAERDTARAGLRKALFEGALHSAIDVIEDVPGELLFQNDLMEYYANNIWVVANCQSERFHSTLSRLPELALKGAESHIGEKGSISNSWLAAGVEVEGVVEDSILFPGVMVRRNSLISRAVVLNGNRIGSDTEIHNALILPFTDEVPRPTPNIGDRCAIGARTSSMKNADFPAQIRNGMTVIGMNVDLPNGFRAEPASYVAPGVGASFLRRIKVARKGTSVRNGQIISGTGRASGSGEPR